MNYEKFCKIQSVLFEMISDRGYLISDESEEDDQRVSERDFLENGEEMIKMSFSKRNGLTIMCFLCMSTTDNSTIHEIAKLMNESNVRNAIIVIKKITPPAKDAIRKLNMLLDKIDVFEFAELEINKTKHHLVPQHILLIKEKEKDLLESYKITKAQLPTIYTTDPIIKYYGWKPGQIVKILRKNGTIYYRCICTPPV